MSFSAVDGRDAALRCLPSMATPAAHLLIAKHFAQRLACAL
jgi:hypothetical protein